MNPIARGRERRRVDRELAEEMAEHIRERAEELIEQGHAPAEAWRMARVHFGNPLAQREASRDAWGWTVIEEFARDLRFAARQLLKAPGFTITAFLTLALGIGASTAVFTLVDSVLLRPLGFRDSGRLVALWERLPTMSPDPTGPNPRHVDLWRKRATAFTDVVLLMQGKRGITTGSERPALVGSVTAEPGLFRMLEAKPMIGRGFQAGDGAAGRDNVVVISYALWRDMFHGDARILDKTIRVGDTPCRIIGVLPESFRFPNANTLRAFRSKQNLSKVPEPAIFLPLVLDLNGVAWYGDYGNFVTLARLTPGVTLAEAQAQLAAIQTEVNARLRAAGSGLTVQTLVQPMREAMVAKSRMALWLLMAAVLGLMLIACLNLANAQLGRAIARQREVAVRSALGASRWRIVRAALAENIALGVCGGGAGILLAVAALDLFRRFAPVDLPRLGEARVDVTVLGFSIALTLGCSIFFGMLPAMKLTRTDPQAALQQNNGRAAGSAESRRIRTLLIGFEVAGCTALLLMTGLFSKSLLNLLREDKGFDTAHVSVAEVDMPHDEYATAQSRTNFDDAILAELRRIPGVESAAMVSAMPLEGTSWIEDLTRTDRPHQENPLLNLRWASPGYFKTMGEKILRGRSFEDRDRNVNSMIVSEGLARAVWPDKDPIGSEVMVEGRKFTIIGIVADARIASLKEAPVNFAYTHYKDRPPYFDYFVVRSRERADALLPAMREAIWRHAPDVTIARVKTLDSQLADSLATERFQTMLLVAFGVAALALAMLGIYGVLSYSVARRKQEIGIRMALGATKSIIYSLTFGDAAPPVIAGLAAGMGASLFGARLVRDLLFGVRPLDAMVVMCVAGLFLTAAAAAAFVPARRAASVNPIDALRTE